MLLYSREEDRAKMNQYYRTSDMIKLLKYFPEISPITDLTIVEDEEDYKKNSNYLNTLENNRVDTLKTNIASFSTDNKGIGEEFLDILKFIKTVDKDAVLVLFNTVNASSERYERFAGISVGIVLGEYVKIDAVGKGFDGREVSKNICTHERYDIPWFELRRITVDNFRNYRTFLIDNENYQETRKERIAYLERIGYEKEIVERALPEKYFEIPDFIWSDMITHLLKKLEREEDILKVDEITNFAISGHTEGKRYMPWQLFDQSRSGIGK